MGGDLVDDSQLPRPDLAGEQAAGFAAPQRAVGDEVEHGVQVGCFDLGEVEELDDLVVGPDHDWPDAHHANRPGARPAASTCAAAAPTPPAPPTSRHHRTGPRPAQPPRCSPTTTSPPPQRPGRRRLRPPTSVRPGCAGPATVPTNLGPANRAAHRRRRRPAALSPARQTRHSATTQCRRTPPCAPCRQHPHGRRPYTPPHSPHPAVDLPPQAYSSLSLESPRRIRGLPPAALHRRPNSCSSGAGNARDLNTGPQPTFYSEQSPIWTPRRRHSALGLVGPNAGWSTAPRPTPRAGHRRQDGPTSRPEAARVRAVDIDRIAP